MIGKPIVAMLMVGLLFSAGIGTARAEDRTAAVQAATKAADAWLKLVDQERYRESWQQAASIFRDKITPEGWETLAKATREHTGALISRKFKLAAYATSLPGAPTGEYVVIEYDASYANIKSVIDKVTPMLDADGQWRVSGYWIQ
jgi:uncharacterized protein DUF4019